MQINFYLRTYLFTNTREVFPPLSNHATLTFRPKITPIPKSSSYMRKKFQLSYGKTDRQTDRQTDRDTDRQNLLLYALHSGVVGLGRQEIGRKTRPDRNGCSVCVLPMWELSGIGRLLSSWRAL